MTLHLTYVNRNFALTVGDRLLTTERVVGTFEPFDQYANKTVVVLGQNCQVAVVYAGRAHMFGSSTADWIAEQILGRPHGAPMRPGAGIPMRLGDRPVHLRGIIDALSVGLKRDLPRQGGGQMHLEMAITGVTFRRRWRFEPTATHRSRPIYIVLKHSGKPTSETVVKPERIERLAPGNILGTLGVKVPDELIKSMSAEGRALVNTGTATDRDIEALLVRTIREVAKTQTSVGTECMVVHLARRPPDVRVKFYRDPSRPTPAFTPWVIAPNVAMPPQISWDGGVPTVGNDNWGMTYEVDPPFPPTGLHSSSSHPQKPWS